MGQSNTRGKNAIVTGARKGIGRAIVEEFAKNGMGIWACSSRRNADFENDMAFLAKECDVQITPIYFDLRSEDEIKTAMKQILSEKRSIDVLVNNAGVPNGGLMQMTSMETLRNTLEINFVAQIFLMQLVSRSMMRQKSGCIINMGSVGGIEAREGYLAYGASKAALLWATRSISKELAKYNIRVNAVAPGLIETDMGNYKKEEERDKIIGGISMKRWGRPEEVAKAVMFLASDDSSFMTGTILNVDGGRLM